MKKRGVGHKMGSERSGNRLMMLRRMNRLNKLRSEASTFIQNNFAGLEVTSFMRDFVRTNWGLSKNIEQNYVDTVYTYMIKSTRNVEGPSLILRSSQIGDDKPRDLESSDEVAESYGPMMQDSRVPTVRMETKEGQPLKEAPKQSNT